MRFMMFMIPREYQPDASLAEKAGEGFAPSAEAIAAMMKYNEKLAKAGALVSLDGLHPISKGARVAFTSKTPTVTDGTSIKAKEVIGGYWMIAVPARLPVRQAGRSARVFLESAQSFRHAGVPARQSA